MALLKPFQKIVITQLLEGYNYQEPFHVYFHKQCKQHSQWGSRDRKTYKHYCYQYFRLGFAVKQQSIEACIELIVNNESNDIEAESIFPYRELISPSVNFESWVQHLSKQSPVFVVVREGKKENVLNWLQLKEIEFEAIDTHTLKLPADAKCNELVEKGWVWIMDLASQMVVNSIEIKDNQRVWDCCSGAGGKALLLTQKFPKISLICSDVRVSILENLRARFSQLRLTIPHIELIDLNEKSHVNHMVDVLIADVPCSGSGTWGRHPESLQSFSLNTPLMYANKQRQIVQNALHQLKPKGVFYYITCSVFKSENEDNVAYFEKEFGLTLISQQAYYNTAHASDYLFMAQFVKN